MTHKGTIPLETERLILRRYEEATPKPYIKTGAATALNLYEPYSKIGG
jgi:hypothetical protein